MVGRLKFSLLTLAAAVAFAPASLIAQEGGRFQVLIPYFTPQAGADDRFGRDASEELRDLINTLATHEAMDKDDIEDEAKRLGYDMEDINCLYAIQLSAQMRVPVAICASYTEGEDRSSTVSATIHTVQTQEEFPLESFTVPRRDGDKEAAQRIFEQFDRYNTQVRSAGICQDYAASQQWVDALRNCDQSLALNPDAMSVRFLRAQILRQMENFDEAMAELERVIAADPFHEDALQLAGYIATTEGDADTGREYYRRYLESNPGNVAIRMRISYEMAQAGDPVGAMEFIEVGLEVDPENVDLLDQFGGFAFRAASDAQAMYALENPNAGLSPEAAGYYRQAIDAYMKVFEARGAETAVDRLRNIVAALIQLEEYGEAAQRSEQFLAAHPDSEVLWSFRADALQRSGQLDAAIAALDRVLEINPEHPTAGLRQGSWLIEAGRNQEAVDKLAALARQRPALADQAGRLVFVDAYQNGYQKDQFNYAIRWMAAAKTIPGLGEELLHQINFFHGYSIYRAAIIEQDGQQTLATAQSTLPKFQEALRIVNQSGNYAATAGLNLQDQVITPINQYISIQEAIIRRGR